MRNSEISNIKVSLDKYGNIKLSWNANDGLHNVIPYEVRMSPSEAQTLCDEIGDILYGELDTFGL